MTEWYYADRSRQRQGPVPATQIAMLLDSGALDLDTLVWRQGLAQWQRLGDFSEELGLLQAPPPVAPPAGPDGHGAAAPEPAAGLTLAPEPADEPAPVTGRAVFTAREPAAYVPPPSTAPRADSSPYTAPTASLAAYGGVVHGGEVVYAGFWKRVAASIIDSLVVGIAGAIVGGVIGGIIGGAMGLSGGLNTSGMLAIQVVSNLVSIILNLSYYGWMHSSSNQATLGKMAVGIKVARSDGEPITFARGVGRYFALWISALPVGIGFLMAAFTQRKQALHDIICDTVVVDRYAFTDQPELQRRELGGVTLAVLIIAGVLMALFIVAMIAIGFTLAGRLH